MDVDKHVDVIYASPKSDVYSIAYENGQKEVFRANDDISESLIDGQMTYNSWRGDVSIVMCKKLVASVDRFDKVVPLTEFLGEDNLSGKPLLVRFVNRSLDVISF